MATLSSLLIQRGVATMRGVEDAIARQVLQGGDLATNVLEVGAGREDDVTHLAAESSGLVAHGVGRLAPNDAGVLRLLPGDVAQRYGIFPIEKRGADLVVATSEPLSQGVEEDLGFLLNLELRPVYALRVRIAQALGEHYAQPMERRYARLLAKLEGRKLAVETEPPPAPGGVTRAPSVPPLRAASEPPRAAGVVPGAGGMAVAVSEPPAAEVMPEPRPTLRGLPRIAESEWGAAGGGESAGGAAAAASLVAALPETIELSPRPSPAVAVAAVVAVAAGPVEPVATGLQQRATGGGAGPAEVTATGLQQGAVAGGVSGEPAATAGAGSAGGSAAPARALAAWAKPPGDGRTPRPGRVRRKGPFPAGLAEEEMQSAVTTEAVLEVFFDFAQQFFEYCALFVVHGDIAEGRDAAGRGADRERVAAIGLPLDLPSTLATARDRRVPVLGELAAEGLDVDLLRDLGRAPASEGVAASPTAPSHRAAAVVIPIVVRGRAVALLFGDDAPHPVELSAIGEVIAFGALAGASIERIILRRKMGRTGPPPSARLSPGALAVSKAPAAAVAGSEVVAAPHAVAAPVVAAPVVVAASPVVAPAVAAPPIQAAAPRAPRAGVAALARMFASPVAAPKPASAAPPPKAASTVPAAAPPAPRAERDVWDTAPAEARPVTTRGEAVALSRGSLGVLAAAVAESLVASRDDDDDPEAARSSAGAAPGEARAFDAIEAGGSDIEDASDAEGRSYGVAASAADDTGSGDGSIAVALQTPSFSDAPAVALQTPSFSDAPAIVDQESSGDALTVALMLPGDTPLPFGTTRHPLTGTFGPEDDEMVSIDEVDDLPDEPSLETVEPDEVELSADADGPAEADSNAETAARPVALLPDHPTSSSEGGMSSGRPVVVEMFADSTEGIEGAIARAAEAMGAREPLVQGSAVGEGGAASPAAPAPPEETLTEGFPAAAPTPAHLSPGVSAAAAAFATPPPLDPGAVDLSSLGLETLLSRAARGPDAAEARVELERRAERNLTPLLALFPGPLDQDRHRSAERLPPASQCGLLLQAIVQTGARGAATVAVLARHDDIDVRFWAAHLLGELPSAEAADGLLSFLVDDDAAVRRIALRSAGSILAASLAGRPLESALGFLARNAHSPLRERLAAIEAMGQLRGSFFVPILVGLLGASPDDVPEAARRALLVVTRQDFGRDAARWSEWWSRNEPRSRIEWLIDALMHDTQSIRRAAGDELKQLTKEYFGYYDDLPKRERERAQERYREWWEREGRGRFR